MSRFPQRVVFATSLVTVLLVGGLVLALFSARGQSRSDLQVGFEQRAEIAAALVESILTQAAESTGVEHRAAFSGESVTTDAVRDAVAVPGGATMVVGEDRRTLAAWPRDTKRTEDLDVAVDAVLEGEDWRLQHGAEDDAPIHVVSAIDSPFGRRAVISSFPGVLLQTFLGTYLDRVRSAQDSAFLVTTDGRVLASGGGRPVDRVPLPESGSGRIVLAGQEQYAASSPVAGTDWSVAVAVPEARLYAPVRGLSGAMPWALLVGVTLLALIVIVLVRRLARGSSKLAEANVALAAQNEEVVAANRMKSDFLATMSHELRTPLNGIIGFAELMHDGRVGPVSDQHREYLGDILSSADHLRRLIDDVLDLSKIEAGKIDLRPERVSCRAVVEEVCDVVGSLAVRKDITLNCQVDPAIDPLHLDPGKLKQVLFNYVSNALKFTPEGGTVSITGNVVEGDRFRLVVEDDGPGIGQEDLDRLWSAFEQLDTGSSRRHGGTGLGLSLTRRIVEAQGGEVGVETAPGRGSRFSVTLPRVVTAEPAPVAEPAPGDPVAV